MREIILIYQIYLILTLNAFEIVIKSWWILQNYRAHVQIIDHSLVRPFEQGNMKNISKNQTDI